MKKYLVLICALALATAVGAGALGLPGGGGKVDTKKIDECIAAMDDLANKFNAAKAKVDTTNTHLSEIATAHGVADVLSDLTKVASLKDQITDAEKATLTADVQTLATIAADIQAITAAVPDLLTNKIPAALADVAEQITKNPLSAGDLKNKQDKLTAGKAALDQIAKDAPALVESATNLTSTLGGIL